MARLTALEIECILAVAGDALASETLLDPDETPAQFEARCDAFERGMDKLRDMLRARTDAALKRKA